MASLNKIQPGQTLYYVLRRRMGNTAMRGTFVFPVKVLEVDLEKREVLASWNSNPAKRWSERYVKKWKVNKPEVEKNLFNRTFEREKPK